MKTPADSLMRLETQRLLIRPFRMADLAAFAEIVGDPEVMRYIGDGSPMSPDPHFSRVVCYSAGSIRQCCVPLRRAPRRTV